MTDGESPAGPVTHADGPSQGAPPGSPLVSVIIPYGDRRARPQHIASWTRRQTLPADRFEVIVLANAGVECEADLRKLLRPHDRLLLTEGEGQYGMYALGAEAAWGELLFFTEDHCVADRACLEATLRHLAKGGCDGASVRWGDINRTAVARMEQLAAAVDAKQWFEEGHWNRVRVRGFAIPRRAYREAGGFRPEYGPFAEAALAASLHARGCRLGFVPDGGVRHVNTFTLADLAENARNYTRGECLYCARHDREFCDRYFAATAVAAEASSVPAAEWREQVRALGGALRGAKRPADAVGLGSELARALARRLRGPLSLRLGARLAVLSGRLRFAFWWFNERRRVEAFRDYWTAVVRCARADYFAEHAPAALAPIRAAGEVSLYQLPGPYPVEHHGGKTFRWTAPVATFRFDLPPGDHVVEIDTQELRGPTPTLPLRLTWNGRVVPPEWVVREKGRVSLAIPREAFADAPEQRLTVVIPPLSLPPGPDRRRLGLPICSLRVTPSRSGPAGRPGPPGDSGSAEPVEATPRVGG
jgi:hypothetical protein